MEEYKCKLLLKKLDAMTDRQVAVFLYWALGLSTQRISDRRKVSLTVTKNEVKAIKEEFFFITTHDDVVGALQEIFRKGYCE